MSMLLTSWAALLLSADAGRVEVEGLVLRAVARPSPIGGFGRRAEYEIEFSATPKGGGQLPVIRFVEPPLVLGADGRAISRASEFGPSQTPQSHGAGLWSTRLTFDDAPGKTLPAVEGMLAVAPSQWKTALFDGAELKTNASVPIEKGRVKLTVLDFEDDAPDVRFRVTLPAAGPLDPTKGPHERQITGSRATLIDAQGKEMALASTGTGYSSDGTTTEHRIRFRSEEPFTAGSLKAIRLEFPTPKGPEKKVRFRILDVPVDERDAKRRMR